MLFSLALLTAMNSTDAADILAYPQTRRGDLVEVRHGISVPDPYRWLEDPNSAETKAWVEAQNKVTRAYLDVIPERKGIESMLSKLINFDRYGAPSRVGDSFFYTKRTGLQNQPVLYVTKQLRRAGRVLLDPNTLSADGTAALGSYELSEDGKLLAYSIQKGGSDWQEWRVRDVETGKDLPDRIEWSKFSGASFSKDGKGFYYSAYDAPKTAEALSGVNYFQKLYYHRLGTPQAQDRLVYERKDQKEWGFSGSESEDGRYLVISVWKGTNRENQVFVQDLKSGGQVGELLVGFDAQYSYLGNDDSTFYFLTNESAPNLRIVAINLEKPDKSSWRTVVPEGKEAIESASLLGNVFYVTTLRDAVSRVSKFDTSGKSQGEVEFPGVGTVVGFGGRRATKDTFYTFSSFTDPGSIYRLELAKGAQSLWKQANLTFKPDDYVTKQVFYRSKDGTRVPMFITHLRDLKLDSTNPTLLYGYGGFGSSMTPFFSSRMMTWMKMGGVLAVACLRGGSEYGNAWHDAGRLMNKQNVFDDAIAAAEYLVAEKYTKPSRMAINGGSNGGLLVGAVVNQRPDLFGAALPEVGVMDMLRFDKFTIGWAWVSDYGSPEKADEFANLLKYSPLHNIRAGVTYPAIMATTGDHDDRVVPAHSYKYTAMLQSVAPSEPALIRIETSAGHGAGKPTAKVIAETADQWAFLVRALNFKPRLK